MKQHQKLHLLPHSLALGRVTPPPSIYINSLGFAQCPPIATSQQPVSCIPNRRSHLLFKDYRRAVAFVGASVGLDDVGASVGKGDGAKLGADVGSEVGCVVGAGLGCGVGAEVGKDDGAQVEEYEIDEVSSSNTLARV